MGMTLDPTDLVIIDSGFKNLERGLDDFKNRIIGDIPTDAILTDHGTFVAATAAATGIGGFGNVGINWLTNLKAVPVQHGVTERDFGDIVNSFAQSFSMKSITVPTVFNLSIGLGTSDPLNNSNGTCDEGETEAEQLFLEGMADEIKLLNYIEELKYNFLGVKPVNRFLVVVAAGNDACELIGPADKPSNLLVVGGSQGYREADGSNWGSAIDIAAPFDFELFDYGSLSFSEKSGTSFSAPLVAGSAALLWACDPTLESSEVAGILKWTARWLTNKGLGIDKFNGAGVLDVYTALGGMNPDATPPIAPTGLTGSVIAARELRLSWNSSPEQDLSGYYIYRKMGSYELWDSVQSPLTTSIESSIPVNGEICYTISAYDSSWNESLQSQEVCVGTVGPAPLQITSIDPSTAQKGEWVTFTLTGTGFQLGFSSIIINLNNA